MSRPRQPIGRPSPTEPNGRDGKGRFAAGNKLARGNPLAKKVQALRVALVNAASLADVDLVMRTIRDVLKNGRDADRLAAARFFTERTLGPPISLDYEERLRQLEDFLLSEDQK
jgi:hypothetical protein